MGLPHGGRQPAALGRVQIAEPAVAISLRLPGPVSQSSMSVTFGLRSSAWIRGQSGCGRDGSDVNGGVSSLRSRRDIVEPCRHWPGDADHSSPAQIFRNRVAADADHGGDLWPLWPQTCLRRRTSEPDASAVSGLAWSSPGLLGSHRAVGG